MSKIIIIGGGASGMVASIFASHNNDVTILEKNNNCGKKILVTGNGKCNYFNSEFTINHYRSENINILNNIINEENGKKVLDFFESIGITPKIKNGYYYPYSNQAVSINKALLLESRISGVKIENNVDVKSVKYENNNFIIETNNGIYKADKVVLATGSYAAPKTGSTGIGYEICKSFNHSIIKPLPALVQLIGEESYFKECSGVKADVNVSLVEDNKIIDTENGEILLTDYGISGICVFQLSGRVSKLLDQNKNVFIKIDFMPFTKDIEESYKYIDNKNNLVKNRTILELLDGMLNYKLNNVIIKKSKIDGSKSWGELQEKEKIELIKNLKEFIVKIKNTNSFDNAQICLGGIPLDEININTMESLKQKDLYIIGELLDVDGDCGGYNLGNAWVTGMLAGSELSK